MKRLRRGAERGGHWLAVDADPAQAAGRDRFQVLDHRDEIAPPDARWIPAQVTAAAVWYGEYPALIAEGYVIGGEGDVIARFDLPTVQRMVADLRAVK